MEMKKTILALAAFILMTAPSFGWGREGHEAIAKIADAHLSPSAKKKIEKYLDNHSIVYWAKWMDDYRRTKEYGFTTKWHVLSVDENLAYVPDEQDGDAVYGINQAVGILKNYKDHPDSTVTVNLKYIIHLVGDMHCPSHIYYKGRNQNYYVDFGGGYVQPRQRMKIHTVWDQGAIKATRIWGLEDWLWELDRLSPKEERRVVEGTLLDWVDDNARRCLRQFELSSTPEENLAQDFVNEAMPLIETQILYAGLRLAKVLNDLF